MSKILVVLCIYKFSIKGNKRTNRGKNPEETKGTAHLLTSMQIMTIVVDSIFSDFNGGRPLL